MATMRLATVAALALLAPACAFTPAPGKPAVGRNFSCSHPKTVAAGEGAAWAVWVTSMDSVFGGEDYSYSLTKIDLRTGRTLLSVDFGDGGLPLLTTGFGAVWVAVYGDRVEKIDATTGETLASVQLRGRFYRFDGIAAGLDAVWVSRGALFRLDPATAQVVATVRLHGKGGQVTTGGGAVWVLTPHGLSRVDPRTNQEVRSIPLDLAGGRRVVFAASSIWVYDSRGRLLRVDPRSNTIVNGVTLNSVAHVIPAGGDSVWIVQKTGSVPKYRLVEVDTAANRVGSRYPIGDWNSNAVLTPDVAERAVWLCVDGRLRRLLLPH